MSRVNLKIVQSACLVDNKIDLDFGFQPLKILLFSALAIKQNKKFWIHDTTETLLSRSLICGRL